MKFTEIKDQSCPRTRAETCSCESIKTISEQAADVKAYVELQQKEFAMEDDGFTSVKHQREVGAGYFDTVSTIISEGDASTLALTGSTEEEQF